MSEPRYARSEHAGPGAATDAEDATHAAPGALPSREELAASLAEIEDARTRVDRSLHVPDAPIFAIWGAFLLLGFAGTALAQRGLLPEAIGPGVVWLLAVPIAVAAHAAVIARKQRGVRPSPEAARRHALEAASWPLMAGLTIALAITVDLTGPETPLLVLLVVGVAYVAYGAAYGDGILLGAGVWLAGIGPVAATVAPAWFSEAMAVLAGGGLLVAAGLSARRARRAQRAGAVAPGAADPGGRW